MQTKTKMHALHLWQLVATQLYDSLWRWLLSNSGGDIRDKPNTQQHGLFFNDLLTLEKLLIGFYFALKQSALVPNKIKVAFKW